MNHSDGQAPSSISLRVDILLKTYILPSILAHQQTRNSQGHRRPFILGLAGPQGVGKTTWAREIQSQLQSSHSLSTLTVSLDDFYLPYQDLLRVARSANRLLRMRGLPGTHDVEFASKVFRSLRCEDGDSGDCQDLLIPVFDKSQFNGRGDRAPPAEWTRIPRNRDKSLQVDVVVFEGWCLGFRPISDQELQRRWDEANVSVAASSKDWTCAQRQLPDQHSGERLTPQEALSLYSLPELSIVNSSLRHYCDSFMGHAHFDALVHLDPADVMFVYDWRIEQERNLIASRNSGMSDEQVMNFVQGYMPAYALYLNNLQTIPFFDEADNNATGKRQLRLVFNRERAVSFLHG